MAKLTANNKIWIKNNQNGILPAVIPIVRSGYLLSPKSEDIQQMRKN